MAERKPDRDDDSPIQADELRRQAARFNDSDRGDAGPGPRIREEHAAGNPHRPPAPSGSIEQHLDMNEEGPLRGDEYEFLHGDQARRDDGGDEGDPLDTVELINHRFSPDMAEESREGDDLSGDEHSAGLQGEEPELRNQPHINGNGVPGGEESEQELTTDEIERQRSA